MKKRRIFGKLLTGMMAAAMLFSLSGCGGNSGAENPPTEPETSNSGEDLSLENVKNAGKLVLGLDATFEPMGYTDENDAIVGFDIDLAEEVCKRMGVELVKQPINWDTKEEDLDTGRIDCIWNGMSVNPSRQEKMNLSEAYMRNSMVFVVPADSDAKTMADLSDRKIGVQNGSTAQEILEASEIGSSITMQTLATNVDALLQMDSGLLDAVFLDSVVAEYKMTADGKDWRILPDGLEEEEYAIGFRKNDQALRDEVQKILSEMKADGAVERISTKWFGSDVTTIK